MDTTMIFNNLLLAAQAVTNPETVSSYDINFWQDLIVRYPSLAALCFIVWQLWKRLKQRDDKMEAVLDRYHQDVNSFKAVLQSTLERLKD